MDGPRVGDALQRPGRDEVSPSFAADIRANSSFTTMRRATTVR